MYILIDHKTEPEERGGRVPCVYKNLDLIPTYREKFHRCLIDTSLAVEMGTLCYLKKNIYSEAPPKCLSLVWRSAQKIDNKLRANAFVLKLI